MINRISLVRNIGLFDSVATGQQVPLAALTLIAAENGRGKTTLAAILRSLATGDPLPIVERKRLAAAHPPHVVLECVGGPPPAMFQNNTWNRTLQDMVVFDDVFIDNNLYSGLAVAPDHRQNLHDLVLGAQGVVLNRQLQQLVEDIEKHNVALRTRSAAIPMPSRGGLSIDDFCALQAHPGIDAAIQEAERNLAAAQEHNAVRARSPLSPVLLPNLSEPHIEQLLQRGLPGIEGAAVARVQAHLKDIKPGGEAWVSDGMDRLVSKEGAAPLCPFCAQDLSGSPLLAHYQAYFGQEYAALRLAVSKGLDELAAVHGEQASIAFERAVRTLGESRAFWSRFIDVPELTIDSASIGNHWKTARDEVFTALNAKRAALLEQQTLSEQARKALERYAQDVASMRILAAEIGEANARISTVKAGLGASNVLALQAALNRLRATQARHTPALAQACTEYLAEKTAKSQTEQQRDLTREALDAYRARVFPAIEAGVNDYLRRFNAGFRLAHVTSVNERTGSFCNYELVINNVPVAIAGGTTSAGQPSFRNTLSAGDRNTLALAFFFASLDQDPQLAAKVVVVDDPISSLDEHRSLTTVQELRRLATRVSQVIVLSHHKPFLCDIWMHADRARTAAVEVARDPAGSTLRIWNVARDAVTEHDRRHELLRTYVANVAPDNRQVAQAIRPTLEAFCRVAFPERFPPGTYLGAFRDQCVQQLAAGQPILNGPDTQELQDLTEYANRFHHDTNPLGWANAVVNDGQLLGFVQRTLAFARR